MTTIQELQARVELHYALQLLQLESIMVQIDQWYAEQTEVRDFDWWRKQKKMEVENDYNK